MKNKLWIYGTLAVLVTLVIGFIMRPDSGSNEAQPLTAQQDQPLQAESATTTDAAAVASIPAKEPAPAPDASADHLHVASNCAGCAQHATHSDAIESERPALKMTDTIQQDIFSLGKNSPISFALPGDGTASGTVELTRQENGRTVMVQGALSSPQTGRFFFQLQSMPGVAGSMVGAVTFDEGTIAYSVEPGADGQPELRQKHVDEVICHKYGMPAPQEETTEEMPGEIPEDHPDNINIPSYQNGVIPLSSLPGATGVIYLDLDGEEAPHQGWGSDLDAAAFNLSSAQIKILWAKVAEDFAPYNLNVTTDLQVYLDAPENSRIRCIITPTSAIYPGAGGVAFLNSFNHTGDKPCWCFYSGNNGALVISHEVGHTLSLSHDGTSEKAYYGGHGSGDLSWGPIMGAPYSKSVRHWSKGEYYDANQTQDDLARIDNNNNNVDYRTDDHANTFAAATYMEIHSDDSVSNQGIIETSTDFDGFRFTTTASGNVSFTVSSVNEGPNLDILAEIVESDGTTVVASANPAATLNATVSQTSLPAGDYILRVSGVAYGSPLTDPPSGFTAYGSLGFYAVTGTVPNGVQPDRLTIAENPASSAVVGTVTPRNSHGADPITFSIASGNSSGAFALTSNGELTVADAAQFDYEALSSYYDDPATFELFVDISNTATPALNETVRVIVEVTDVNEAPTVSTGGPFTLLEHTLAGTPVTQVSASDPDHYDFTTYAITAGNTGNAFAIDSNSGEITLVADTDITVQSVYNLTVTATDQGTPGLTDSTTVTINLIDIPDGYTPGSVNQAYYLDITGSAISDLTSAAKYPSSPDELYVRNELGSHDYGDHYGTRMRGYIIPPATGTYTFWLAMGDSGRLLLSTDANPANATVFHETAANKWANFAQWDKYPEQQSTTVVLTAGQPYYFEMLHKESTAGDWVSVGWQGPTLGQQLVSGLYIAPYPENYTPTLADASFNVASDAANGTVVGQVTGTDINQADTIGSYTILSGNTSGAFAIDPATGQITVSNDAAITEGAVFALMVRASDDGTPALSDTVIVAIEAVSSLVSSHFEASDGFTGYTGNNVTLATTVDNMGATWSTPDDARIWNRSDIPPLGVQCLQLGQSGSTTTAEVTIPGTTHGVGNVRFNYASFSESSDADFSLWYRVGSGDWVQAWSTSVSGMSPNWEVKPWPFVSVDVNQPGDVDLKLQVSGTKGVLIDTFEVLAYSSNTVVSGSTLQEDFEPYDVENPTDFSVDGTPTGNWTSSNLGTNATRIFSTGNFGETKLWISNVNGSSITNAGILAGSNADYTLTFFAACETSSSSATGTMEYDILVGQNAVTAVSLVGGPQSITVHGDNWQVGDSKIDHLFSNNFQTGTLNPGDRLFVAFKRVSSGSWVGVDDVRIELNGLAVTPIGDIAVGGMLPGGGMTLSWTTANGQVYNVETNADLMAPSWGIYDTVIGDGGDVTVTGSTDQVQLFYQVISE